jgi:hypothetical protein
LNRQKKFKLAATVIASVVVMFFILFCSLPALLAFVFHASRVVSWGFLIVSGIYLLLGVFVYC